MRKEDERNQETNTNSTNSKKIDIVEERLVVGKEKVERGKVVLHKRVIEEDVPLDLELAEEHLDVEVKKIRKVVDERGPAVREEGDTKIFSVYREVFVKQTILEEEVRITRKQTRKPFHTSEKLRREVIDVERSSGNKKDEDIPRENRNSIPPSRSNSQGDDTRYNEQGDLSGYNRIKE